MSQEEILRIWSGTLLNCTDDCQKCGQETQEAKDCIPCCPNCQ